MTVSRIRNKAIAWVVILTFLFSIIMPANLVAGNSIAEAATQNNNVHIYATSDHDGLTVEEQDYIQQLAAKNKTVGKHKVWFTLGRYKTNDEIPAFPDNPMNSDINPDTYQNYLAMMEKKTLNGQINYDNILEEYDLAFYRYFQSTQGATDYVGSGKAYHLDLHIVRRTTGLTIQKEWIGPKPDTDLTFTVEGTVDGKTEPIVTETVTLKAADNFAAQTIQVPIKYCGQEITYDVTETPVEGYDVSIIQNNNYSFTVTNTYRFRVQYHWTDADGVEYATEVLPLPEHATGQDALNSAPAIEVPAGNPWYYFDGLWYSSAAMMEEWTAESAIAANADANGVVHLYTAWTPKPPTSIASGMITLTQFVSGNACQPYLDASFNFRLTLKLRPNEPAEALALAMINPEDADENGEENAEETGVTTEAEQEVQNEVVELETEIEDILPEATEVTSGSEEIAEDATATGQDTEAPVTIEEVVTHLSGNILADDAEPVMDIPALRVFLNYGYGEQEADLYYDEETDTYIYDGIALNNHQIVGIRIMSVDSEVDYTIEETTTDANVVKYDGRVVDIDNSLISGTIFFGVDGGIEAMILDDPEADEDTPATHVVENIFVNEPQDDEKESDEEPPVVPDDKKHNDTYEEPEPIIADDEDIPQSEPEEEITEQQIPMSDVPDMEVMEEIIEEVLADIPVPMADMTDIEVPVEEVAEVVEDMPVPLGDAPATGDNTQTAGFAGMLLAAMAGLCATRRRKN